MLPLWSFAINWLAIPCIRKKGARKLVFIWASKSSRELSRILPLVVRAAEFRSALTVPNSACAALSKASHSSVLAISQDWNSTFAPFASSSAFARAPFSAERPARISWRDPEATNSWATARPSPCVPPVIRAVVCVWSTLCIVFPLSLISHFNPFTR